MSGLSTATMTPSSLYDWKYAALHSNSEVFGILPSMLDNMLDSPMRSGSFWAYNPNEFSAFFEKYRVVSSTQNIISPTTDQTTEEVLPLNQIYETNVIPDTIRRNWQKLVQAGLTRKTYLYILKLASKNVGWRGQGSCPMKAQSLANFLWLWNKVAEFAQEPEFVLLPHGNLQIEWYKDDRHFVELEFQSNKKIIFGIFDGETIIEGIAHAKEIVPLLRLRDFTPFKRSHLGQTKQAMSFQS